jgi:hypothetical protein
MQDRALSADMGGSRSSATDQRRRGDGGIGKRWDAIITFHFPITFTVTFYARDTCTVVRQSALFLVFIDLRRFFVFFRLKIP